MATLIQAVEAGRVDRDKIVMLNVTGGGEECFQRGKELWYLKPHRVFPLDPDPASVAAVLDELFA